MGVGNSKGLSGSHEIGSNHREPVPLPDVTFHIGERMRGDSESDSPTLSVGPQTSSSRTPTPTQMGPSLRKRIKSLTTINYKQAAQVTTRLVQKRIYGLNKSPQDCFLSLFPSLIKIRHYKLEWIPYDFAAGIIVSMIHFTQVFATAMTGSLKPERGLTLLIFPGLVYALLATSPHNSLGGMPITAATISVSVVTVLDESSADLIVDGYLNMSDVDQNRQHFRIMTGICFYAGLFLVAMGLLKLGFLSAILSPTVMEPFAIACFLQSICGQLPSMFGLAPPVRFGYGKHFRDIIFFFGSIGQANGWEALMSFCYASLVLAFREFLQPKIFQKIKMVVPIEFILYAVCIGLSYGLDLKNTAGIRIVDNTYGVPRPKSPSLDYGPDIIWAGFINGIVAYSVTLGSARTLARKARGNISPNQELLALGCAHIFGSFFSCMTMAAPMGRGIVNQSMGSRSQLSSVVGCVFMALIMNYASDAISYLPYCVISTNIIVSLSQSLNGFEEIPKLWRNNKFDACIWVLTFMGGIGLNVQIGLLLGVSVSILGLILRSQRPRIRVLGRLKNSGGFVPLKYYEKAEEVYGIRILQIQNPIHYANAQYLIQSIKQLALEPYGAKAPLTMTHTHTPLEISTPTPTTVPHLRPSSSFTINRNISFPSMYARNNPIARALGVAASPFGSSNNLALELERRQENSHPLDSYANDGALSRTASPMPSTVSHEFILVGHAATTTSPNASRVILDMGTVSYIDAVGIRALEQLASDLKVKAIEVILAQCKGPLLRQLKELAAHKIIPERNIFPSVVDAVDESIRRIKVNTSPAEGRLGEYRDDRFWDIPLIPVEGLPFVDYDMD